MLGYRLLLVGAFLTPFSQLLVIAGVGFSVGDAFLVAGALHALLDRHVARDVHPRLPAWPFLTAGAMILVGVLVSGLTRQNAMMFDISSLALQYATVLVLLVLALRGMTRAQLETLTVALVTGLVVSVLAGLALVVAAPAVVASLDEAGYMVVLGGDRHGLFTGVGELSKLAAVSLPLTYYLAARGRIGAVRTLLFVGVTLLAVVVTRSASGVATTVVVVAVLFVLHLLQRRHTQGSSGVTLPRLVLGAVAAGGVTYWLLGRLDEQGAGFTEGFVARLVQPFLAEGVEGVGSASLRTQLMHEAWDIIGDGALLGMGPGLYHPVSPSGQGVHVVPLMMWAETGLLTVLGWGVLVLGGATVLWRRWRTAGAAGVAAWAALGATVIWHLAAPYMYQRIMVLPLLLGYLLAVAAAAGKVEEAPVGEPDPAQEGSRVDLLHGPGRGR